MKKTLSVLALSLLCGAGLLTPATAAPQFGAGRERSQARDRVCFYQDIRYQGWEQCYMAGDEVTSLGNRKDAISSIRIFGRARVTVYDETDFRGRSAEFTSDVPDLKLRSAGGGHTWNDRIESLRVSSDYDSRDYRTPQSTGPVFGRNNSGICVYDRPDYQGREQCWSIGESLSDLARAGSWSDRISSVRVFGRAAVVLYRDIDFRGESIVVDHDIPDLASLPGRNFRSWDRQASSLVVESDRGGFPGRGRARGRF
jgi:hypothetical protein